MSSDIEHQLMFNIAVRILTLQVSCIGCLVSHISAVQPGTKERMYQLLTCIISYELAYPANVSEMRMSCFAYTGDLYDH